ncbi:Wadjet anti-phage system protein JetA family protein [Alkaliphilus sp. B6464]|uniref:Wadjet anti-phage system protein JetA family protein n=1 Tax=Alkaliphilus sp. B6464 TaxID=2731219 RepID=UPI00201193BB|nr:Wadjet anti-phage system protein JetA family protein [Alkaliphilus sp. B6464]
MKLFEIIPDKFLSILASKDKEVYSDCLFILFNQYRGNTSFGIDREIVVHVFTDYFEELGEVDLFEDEDASIKSSRDEANFIIRKLKDCGWIDIETTTSYREIINLTDYTISILGTLEKIVKNESLEYQGYVYTIYSILFGSENNQYNVILYQVFENTMKLMNGLKTLNSNIKKYIGKITEQKTSEEIMKHHFQDYAQDVIDKGYHRLKTSDNVSKFRPKILERLEEIKRDKDYLQRASQQEVDIERADNLDVAKEKIMGQLNEIIYVFENMDEIISEIDRKNTQYIRASLTRVKYLLNSSNDIEGQINEILKYTVEKIEENEVDLRIDTLEEINSIFGFYPQRFIDHKSLYIATEGKKSFEPQKLNEDDTISEEERERRIKEIQEKKKILSRGNKMSIIERYNYLNSKQKDEFARITNKLLYTGFLTKKKEDNKKDYYFVENHKDIFINYFKISGWELEIDDAYGVIHLVNQYDQNRHHFKLYESIILLILRLLYYEKMQELSLAENVIVNMDDIHRKFLALKLRDKPIDKITLRSAISLFKKFNLIDLIDSDINLGDSRMIIYPTILLAVRVEDIRKVYEKLDTYRSGEVVDDEEANEDEND